MQHADVRRCAEALAKKVLPILPGDMLLFKITKERMLVVCATKQATDDATASVGQRIAGIRHTRWEDTWINWDGLDVLWSIVRLP